MPEGRSHANPTERLEVSRSPWWVSTSTGYVISTVRFNDGSTTTALQHREVMAAHLGRKLLRGQHVHHKDGRRTNNALSNLELLSASDHSRLHRDRVPPVSLTCRLCRKEFLRKRRWERGNRKQRKFGPFCGKVCAGRWSRQQQLDRRANDLRRGSSGAT